MPPPHRIPIPYGMDHGMAFPGSKEEWRGGSLQRDELWEPAGDRVHGAEVRHLLGLAWAHSGKGHSGHAEERRFNETPPNVLAESETRTARHSRKEHTKKKKELK